MSDYAGQRNIHFAGRYIGYEKYHTAQEFAVWTVAVIDLRSGRHVHDVGTGNLPPNAAQINQDATARGIGPTKALVLRPTGSVAWIAEDTYQQFQTGTPSYQVSKVDRHGMTLLDSGTKIDPTSLKLVGRTLSWSDGGAIRTATIT